MFAMRDAKNGSESVGHQIEMQLRGSREDGACSPENENGPHGKR